MMLGQKNLQFDQLILDKNYLPDPEDAEDMEMVRIINEQYKCEKHQLFQVKYFKQQQEQVSCIVWPCATGKTYGLMACSKYFQHLYPKKKILICVPRDINRSQALAQLGLNQDDLEEVGKAGIFVLTFQKLMKLNTAAIKNSILLVDEFHSFMTHAKAIDILPLPEKVHAVTATIGEQAGKQRYERYFENKNISLKILDFTENKVQGATILLETVAVEPKDNADRKPILKKAIEIAKLKKKDNKNVVIFCKGMNECKLVKSEILGQKSDYCAVLDDSASVLTKSMHMLKCIEKGESDIKVVLTTQLVSSGLNIFKMCYVILTEVPTDNDTYKYLLGKSNRDNFNGFQE